MEDRRNAVEPLFREFTSESLHLKNRIVMAPMTRGFSPQGIPSAQVADYYKKRADGGVGLIITEGTLIDHKAASGHANVPQIFGSKAIAGWKHVIQSVQGSGAKIIPQLWHVGNMRKPGTGPDPAVPAYGPMSISKSGQVQTVGMSQADIKEVVEAYGNSAKTAFDIGFDGIEVHGAHGYLIDQFLWHETNQRTDGYGGSIENRSRFAVEVVENIRQKVPGDFPVIFRFSQWKLSAYDAKLANTPEELERILTPIKNAGVDVFHASSRRFFEAEFTRSPLNLAAWTKRVTGKPTITVGSIGLDSEMLTTANKDWNGVSKVTNVHQAAAGVSDNNFDLVAVGRGLLGDPQWANKVREGRFEDIAAFSKQSLSEL